MEVLVRLGLGCWATLPNKVADSDISVIGGEERLGPAFFSEVDKGKIVVLTAVAFVMVSPDKDASSPRAE